ncbi:hypothetical protein ACIQWN_37350 [Streptomyces vinaceus]|uniref:hypothetical protein n=1 Tax=Streptomyces vinaceus TaxID=1960 RepID=UPI0038258F5F
MTSTSTARRLTFTAALASASALLAGALPASSALAAAEKPSQCVLRVAGPAAGMQCFDTFRKAIDNATGGRVKDAPLASSATAAAAVRERVNASTPVGRSATGQDPVIMATIYDHEYLTGSSLTLVAPNDGHGPCDSSFLAPNKYRASLPDLRTVFYPNSNTSWDNRPQSWMSYNNCQVAVHQDPGYVGPVQLQAFPTRNTIADKFGANGVSSVTIWSQPTLADLEAVCKKAVNSCVFRPQERTFVAQPRTDVATAWNCTPITQSTTQLWTKTYTTQRQVGVELGVTGGWDLFQKFEVSVKASYQQSWTDTTTLTQTTPLVVSPGHKGTLTIVPTGEKISGMMDLDIDLTRDQALGYAWSFSFPYSATRVPQEQAFPVVWNERPMTGEERNELCSSASMRAKGLSGALQSAPRETARPTG